MTDGYGEYILIMLFIPIVFFFLLWFCNEYNSVPHHNSKKISEFKALNQEDGLVTNEESVAIPVALPEGRSLVAVYSYSPSDGGVYTDLGYITCTVFKTYRVASTVAIIESCEKEALKNLQEQTLTKGANAIFGFNITYAFSSHSSEYRAESGVFVYTASGNAVRMSEQNDAYEPE